MVPDRSSVRRRAVLATAGAGLSGLAGCNFGYLGDTSSDRPPLWGESIRVGVLATGERLPHGKAIEHGAQMVAERINADGGIAGAGIELEVADTEVSPEIAREEHQRLCEEEDCDLTLGLFLGSAVLETLQSIAEQETVHLTTGSLDGRAGAQVAEYDYYRYHFRPGLPHTRDLADAQVEFVETNAAALDWERAALISENIGDLEAYHERLEDRLPEVLDVPISQVAGGVGDWSPLYNEVEAADCDVLIAGMVLGGPTAIRQWAYQERDFAFGGLNGFAMAPGYWAETEGAVEYSFTLDGLTRRSDNTGRTRGFVDDYAFRFGSVPVYSAATTYDAIELYRQAVESIVAADDTELPSQDAIVEALEAVTFTNGLLYDELSFTGPDADLAHEPAWESMEASGVPVVQQWQADGEGGGERVAVGPPRGPTAAYQRPPWLESP